MSFTVKTTVKIEEAGKFIASSILDQLNLGKHVLFFVPGGSALSLAVEVAKLIKKHSHQNLTIMLTDERYGPSDHFNSNYFQLMEKGFDLPQAKIIPVLTENDIANTTEKFESNLNEELKLADYKIGLFGVGVDGHTAGILPDSIAVHCQTLACSYDTPVFSRITITSKVIEKLDAAIIWAQGEEKWKVIKNLEKDIDINLEPMQILKKVPLLTIFTNM